MKKSTNMPTPILDVPARVPSGPLGQAELLSAAEVVALYPVTLGQLDHWRRIGAGPRCFDVVGRVVYPTPDLEAWCASLGIARRPAPVPADGPVECAPWCKDGDGHGEATFRDDQRCFSEDLRVDLSAQLPIEESILDESGVWVPGPDYVAVYLQRDANADPVLCVAHADDDYMRFTPGEARQLIEALQLLLGQTA